MRHQSRDETVGDLAAGRLGDEVAHGLEITGGAGEKTTANVCMPQDLPNNRART